MENNTKDVSVLAIILIFIFLFLATITSCMKKNDELKVEQTRIFLDRDVNKLLFKIHHPSIGEIVKSKYS